MRTLSQTEINSVTGGTSWPIEKIRDLIDWWSDLLQQEFDG